MGFFFKLNLLPPFLLCWQGDNQSVFKLNHNIKLYAHKPTQDRVETCFKDCARIGYEIGPVKQRVIDVGEVGGGVLGINVNSFSSISL